MYELFTTVKPKKIEPVQTVEPHTSINTTRNDRFGYICDRVEISHHISEIQQKELEKTWFEIPKKYTQHIKKLIIRASQHDLSTGQYFESNNTIIVNVGWDDAKSGASYTLQHEVHHNMWSKVRTISQKKTNGSVEY